MQPTNEGRAGRRKNLLRINPVLIVVTLLSGLSSAQATPVTPFRVRLSSAPSTLDWNVATTGSESAIIQNIMDGLFIQDARGLPKLGLAKSYAWSKDRKELKIELKSGVSWVDGKPLEAKHFIDSYRRLLSPELNSQNASLLFDVVGARDYFLGKLKNVKEVGVSAPSHHTLLFHLNEPRANFLSILTHWSTYPVRLENLKLTLGSYRITSESKELISLQARNSHRSIPQVVFQVITDGEIALKQFRAGKIDYLLQLEDSWLNSPALKGLPEPGLVDPVRVVVLLHFNPVRLMTNTPEKRRAIMKAIPLKKLLADNSRTRTPAPSLIPAGMLGGPDLQGTTLFTPQGETASLPNASLLLAYPNDAFSRSIAEAIQKNCDPLKIKIEALPEGELSNASKRYDLVLTLFGLDYADPDQLLSSFLSQGTLDLFNLSSSELLRLVERARATEDPGARGKVYEEAANLLENKAALVMPLFYRRRGFLLSDQYRFDDKRQGTALLSGIEPKK